MKVECKTNIILDVLVAKGTELIVPGDIPEETATALLKSGELQLVNDEPDEDKPVKGRGKK